jgi:hypothetical protein
MGREECYLLEPFVVSRPALLPSLLMLFLRIGLIEAQRFTLCSRDLEWFLKIELEWFLKIEIWNTTKKGTRFSKNRSRELQFFLVLEC